MRILTFKPALLLRSSATARPNGLKEGLRTLSGRDRAAHELGRIRKLGTGDRKLERTQSKEGGAEGGGRYL